MKTVQVSNKPKNLPTQTLWTDPEKAATLPSSWFGDHGWGRIQADSGGFRGIPLDDFGGGGDREAPV